MGNRTSCCGCDDKRLFGLDNDKEIMKQMFAEDMDENAKELEARMAHINWAKEKRSKKQPAHPPNIMRKS